MPKQSRKESDVNVLVKLIVEETPKDKKPTKEKNPATVALGKLGGKKGGAARARKLTAKKRIEIAITAAQIRWKKTES